MISILRTLVVVFMLFSLFNVDKIREGARISKRWFFLKVLAMLFWSILTLVSLAIATGGTSILIYNYQEKRPILSLLLIALFLWVLAITLVVMTKYIISKLGYKAKHR